MSLTQCWGLGYKDNQDWPWPFRGSRLVGRQSQRQKMVGQGDKSSHERYSRDKGTQRK